MAENAGSVDLVIIKEGVIEWSLDLNVVTSDGSAISAGEISPESSLA